MPAVRLRFLLSLPTLRPPQIFSCSAGSRPQGLPFVSPSFPFVLEVPRRTSSYHCICCRSPLSHPSGPFLLVGVVDFIEVVLGTSWLTLCLRGPRRTRRWSMDSSAWLHEGWLVRQRLPSRQNPQRRRRKRRLLGCTTSSYRFVVRSVYK